MRNILKSNTSSKINAKFRYYYEILILIDLQVS